MSPNYQHPEIFLIFWRLLRDCTDLIVIAFLARPLAGYPGHLNPLFHHLGLI
jgi:hypothetical protein